MQLATRFPVIDFIVPENLYLVMSIPVIRRNVCNEIYYYHCDWKKLL